MNRRTKWMKNTRNLITSLQAELRTKDEEIKQLQAEKEKLNGLALGYKKSLYTTRERCQIISMENSETREIIAKALHINVGREEWWDVPKDKKNAQIVEAIHHLQK